MTDTDARAALGVLQIIAAGGVSTIGGETIIPWAGRPEISCPRCQDDVIAYDFTCPSCLFYLDTWARRDHCIFWDPARCRWYKAYLTNAENAFWAACLIECPAWLDQLIAQAQIGPYRTDFLLSADRIIIEIDGFSNHSSAADITRDRQRQRWLEFQGFRVIRFSNQEILAAPNRCVTEADALVTWYRRHGAVS